MSSYFIDFVAHVDERKRPENFPRELHLQDTFKDVESTEQLQFLVNERFIRLVTSQGLVVLKDHGAATTEGLITFDKRRFVPWHMITHMEVSVKHIPAPKPMQDDLIPSHPIPEKKEKDIVH